MSDDATVFNFAARKEVQTVHKKAKSAMRELVLWDKMPISADYC